MKIINIVLEIIGWFQIAFGCALAGALLGAALCQVFPSHERFTIFTIGFLLGSVIGVIWATRIWRKHGTVEWLSSYRRIS
jgi:ABC-type enterochelin transport system permease subunit